MITALIVFGIFVLLAGMVVYAVYRSWQDEEGHK